MSLSAISATALASSGSFLLKQPKNIKVLAFDAFPIFDLKPVNVLAETLFPGKGKEFTGTWRTTQFEYCWLRTSAGRYRDFLDITKDALVLAAKKTGVPLDPVKQDQLISQYLQPGLWPDVIPSLTKLRQSGIKLGILSNMSGLMLQACTKHNRIENYFDELISTDKVNSYKPDPAAYKLAMKRFGLPKDEILFTASAGWDACGAKWVGLPTFWVNRSGAPAEELQVAADATGKNLDDLITFLGI